MRVPVDKMTIFTDHSSNHDILSHWGVIVLAWLEGRKAESPLPLTTWKEVQENIPLVHAGGTGRLRRPINACVGRLQRLLLPQWRLQTRRGWTKSTNRGKLTFFFGRGCAYQTERLFLLSFELHWCQKHQPEDLYRGYRFARRVLFVFGVYCFECKSEDIRLSTLIMHKNKYIM